MKIGINGLGRIGRLTLRVALERGNLVPVINTSVTTEQLAHLLKYDSTHGTADFNIKAESDCLMIQDRKIRVLSHKNIDQIPWPEFGVDVVLECSGKYNKRDRAAGHLSRGSKVIVSAPCDDADGTIIWGVNEHLLSPDHQVISIGSCTTNALAPVAKVLHEAFGIESGYATTVHSYTFDQNLLDNFHEDIRRSRAATMSMIPTKSGISKALKLVLPELGERISGSAIRVPVPNVSLIDFTFKSAIKTDVAAVNDAIARAAVNSSVLKVAEERLVSIDYNHSTFSSIFDPFETQVLNGDLVRVLCWYDNEWAFANRMVDVAEAFYKVA